MVKCFITNCVYYVNKYHIISILHKHISVYTHPRYMQVHSMKNLVRI